MSDASNEKHVVIALCGSAKKKRQSFDKLQRYLEDVGAARSGSEGCGDVRFTFSFLEMHYDEVENKFSTVTREDADVVLHKISTLPPSAVGALRRWCVVASKERRRRHLPPVILVDPVEKTRLVLRRSLIYKLLGSHLKRPFCQIPCSWLWTRDEVSLVPLGFVSLGLNDEEAAGSPGTTQHPPERWWMAKPDLSTGPPFTHHMVIWKGVQPKSDLPEEVRCLLPPSGNAFVVQEFLSYALPVVIKVYCIGSRVFVKAVSTTPLLRRVLSGMGAPVFVDSQSKFLNETGWEEEEACWRSYLAEGGRAHTQCSQIAKVLFQGLGLTLFGFDLLLTPEHGLQQGSTLPAALSISQKTSPHTILLDTSLFDVVTGAPSALLCSASPVLIDVNYFPGFAGVEDAAEHMLDAIKAKVLEASVTHVRPVLEKLALDCHRCC
ncbi:hypothetical protein TraAM80_01968 [Trypanosoma rangeli]|uniref:Uncharacterized protein n=1 Tax=Trypanosoma rangeli TaxID=5698 RepID=A0A3S5IS50_TRYRA|nr:uncharacterized protein TraAM80_01968 [Trypanosoma rangeli]RNF09916.1 hypothetical protein TraAM80_01968 [Trypanosoma rangeli]|eukprot:RNF09916.1 hypothetical protein TraAM80_01968 [Trypanosoma rangeli]